MADIAGHDGVSKAIDCVSSWVGADVCVRWHHTVSWSYRCAVHAPPNRSRQTHHPDLRASLIYETKPVRSFWLFRWFTETPKDRMAAAIDRTVQLADSGALRVGEGRPILPEKFRSRRFGRSSRTR